MVARVEENRGTGHVWLLLIPFIGLLWVPFYNVRSPELFGFPFFYWYQLLWVPLSSIITWVAWRLTRREQPE